MCGIAGYFGWDLNPMAGDSALSRMCAAMTHRGPDDEGRKVFEGCGLAMRRLSVVDLSGGRQPMCDPAERHWLVFNGEIYNHRELRPRLLEAGAQLRTQSDTEVLLWQLAGKGRAGLDGLNGMFGLALYDERERSLLLCRDRVGVKPLYYWTDGRRLLFASEIKALLASGLFRPELEPRALWDYLTFRYVPGPHTMWRGVFKLPPGCSLSVSAERPEPEISRWWDYPQEPAAPEPASGLEAETRARLDAEFARLFTDALELRLLADVPVGIMLSGGLDSSAVAAVAARAHGGDGQVRTFSVAFEGAPEADERKYARLVAGHIGARHCEVVIGQREFTDFLPDFVHATDEPLADLASIPLYYVSKLAREHVTVVLSGEGSDEILGGYDLDLWQDIWDREPTDYRQSPAPNMTAYMDSHAKRLLTGLDYPDSLEPLLAELAALGPRAPLEQRLRVLCRHWLVEDLLMKADKMSMACSLELRTPFLDYRLVEWAQRAPLSAKVWRGPGGAYVSKRALRDFARPLLPPAVLTRAKMGFPVPVYEWLSGPLFGLAQDLLASPSCWLRQLCDPGRLDAMLGLGLRQDAELLDRHRLWNLMILELWGRHWGRP